MLVLTRRVGEEIILGDGIRVRVVALAGGRVRLGVEAPASVAVDRAEVRERREPFAAAPPCPVLACPSGADKLSR